MALLASRRLTRETTRQRPQEQEGYCKWQIILLGYLVGVIDYFLANRAYQFVPCPLGGSWVTTSLYFNNWPTLSKLVFGDGQGWDGWMLDLPFVTPDGSNIFSDGNQQFFGSVLWSVMAKAKTGMWVSLAHRSLYLL